ncbi:hypothetical protein MAR_027496, partial [Mya arenaria]
PTCCEQNIGYWNIEGLTSKCYFNDFKKYIFSFDIFARAETWEETTKIARRGRAMGGMSVYIRKTIMQYIEHINFDFKIGIILKINRRFMNIENDTLLLFVYLPANESPFYNNIPVKGIHFLEDKLDTLATENPNNEMILI